MVKGNVKIKHKKGEIDKVLLQRIDNIDDESDFNPYKSTRKTITSSEELFNNEDYSNDEESGIESDIDAEERSKREKKIAAIVIPVVIIVIGLAFFVTYKVSL